MASFDYGAYMAAAKALLVAHTWTSIPTPAVRLGARDGFDDTGPIIIVGMADERAEGKVFGMASQSWKPLLIMGAIPWVGLTDADQDAEEIARGALRTELEELFKKNRGTGGVQQIKIQRIVPSYVRLNGPNGSQRYRCVTLEINGWLMEQTL